MESLGWDDSQVLTNTSALWNSCPQPAWSNQENQESWIASNSNSCLFSGKNMDFTEEDIFNQIQDQAHKTQISQLNSCSDRRQETPRLVANTILAKSGAATSWVDASTRELISSPYGSTTGFCINDRPRIINGLPDGKTGVSTGSLESLHCLLSASNSNTDTSIEDDGISVIFSDCRNLWNFGANSGAASSGESENNASIARNKEMQYHYLDETASQSTCSDKQCCQTAKPASTKRTNDQTDLKVGCLDLLQKDSSTTLTGFRLISDNPSKPKRFRSDSYRRPSSSNINFQQPSSSSVSSSVEEPDPEAIAQMKEMIYRAAAFRPVNLGLEVVEKPKRKNVRISSDPQTVAARQRRERISERIRVLQRLVPGGSKMDTASMLDEAANYLKFLRSQVKALESLGHKLEVNSPPTNIAFSSLPFTNHNHPFHPMQQTHLSSLQNPNHIHHPQT